MEPVVLGFSRQLRYLRLKRGISQDDLSRKTGIHATAIGRFEHGKREPRLTTILRLANGLGVTPGELLGEPFLPPSIVRTEARIEVAAKEKGVIDG